MKKYFLFPVFVSFVCAMRAQSFEWARTALGSGSEWISAVTSDSAGNIYSGGQFPFTTYFGPDSLISYRQDPGQLYTDIFISKCDTAGNLQWLQQISGLQWEWLGNILVATNGDVLVSFWSEDNCTFGKNGIQTTPGYKVGRFSSNGQPLGVMNAYGMSVISEMNNTIYLAGTGVRVMPHGPNIGINCIGRMNANGQLLWKKNICDSSEISRISGIVPGDSGDIIISGMADGYIGAVAIHGMFIAKYDGNGNALWADSLGFNGENDLNQLGIDPWGNTCLVTHQGDSLVLAKFDPDGNMLWKLFYPDQSRSTYALHVDQLGNIFVAGNDNMMSGISFINKYDLNGALTWHREYFPGFLISLISGDKRGHACVGGSFWGNATLGNTSVSNYPNDCCSYGDIFWGRLNDSSFVLGNSVHTIACSRRNCFPNPTHGLLTLNAIPENSEVKIYNVLGENIYSTRSAQSTRLTIDLSDKPKGIYFVRLISENESSTQKIIIE